MSCASPTSSRSPLKQGPEEEVGEQAVLSHKCCSGLADHTVMQILFVLPLLEGGNAGRFFILCFLCLVRCLLSFFCSSLLRVVV